MKLRNVLKAVFCIVLGLGVLVVVGMGVDAYTRQFLPRGGDIEWELQRVATGALLMGCGIVVLVISFLVLRGQQLLADGIFLGGLFTVLVAMLMTLGYPFGWRTILVEALSLLVIAASGWFRFHQQLAI